MNIYQSIKQINRFATTHQLGIISLSIINTSNWIIEKNQKFQWQTNTRLRKWYILSPVSPWDPRESKHWHIPSNPFQGGLFRIKYKDMRLWYDSNRYVFNQLSQKYMVCLCLIDNTWSKNLEIGFVTTFEQNYHPGIEKWLLKKFGSKFSGDHFSVKN